MLLIHSARHFARVLQSILGKVGCQNLCQAVHPFVIGFVFQIFKGAKLLVRQLQVINGVQSHSKYNVFACKICGVVVFGEGNLNVKGGTNGLADNTVNKAWDKALDKIVCVIGNVHVDVRSTSSGESIKMMKIGGLSASFLMNNLFTITNYSGIDPETPGTVYPQSRSFTFSLSLSF